MNKIEQFLSSINLMTKKNFVKWMTTSEYMLKNKNDNFNSFIKESMDALSLDPRKSYTGEFYGNIVSLFYIQNPTSEERTHNVFLQTSPDSLVKPVNMEKFNNTTYSDLVDELVANIQMYLNK